MLPVMVPPVAVFCSVDGHPSPPYFRHCDASVHARAQIGEDRNHHTLQGASACPCNVYTEMGVPPSVQL